MIEWVINGTPFTDFVEGSVTSSLTSMANDFRFVASAVGTFPPFKQGDPVVARVDGETVLTGFIDEVSGSDSEGSHVVAYSGRDRTGDFLDSQINVIDDIQASDALTLQRIIRIVLDHLGSGLQVLDAFGPPPFNQAEDIVTPEAGESAFDFVSKYAKKRQALLSSTGDGDILITQSEPTDSGAVVQRLSGSDSNNILRQSWTINATTLHNKYVHRGQLDPRALNFTGGASVENLENQSGQFTNSDARAGRQFVKVEGESYGSDQLTDRAKWTGQLAKARATRFSCTVRGHQMPAGGIWEVNTLVQVNSDVADISRKMLLDSLTFSESENGPTITSLELVEANVYTINQQLLSQRPAGRQNDVFSSVG